jgi:hypothetical protein
MGIKMPTDYQKIVWKQNQNKIIQLLNEQPLTFKQTIEKSSLSRSVVNEHLKALETKSVIKKEYKNGKLLNVLQLSKIDLVEWFLAQLESIGVPKEIVEKGRAIINEELLIMSVFVNAQVMLNILNFSKRERTRVMGEGEDMYVLGEDTFSPVARKAETPAFKIKTMLKGLKDEEIRTILRELSVSSFAVALDVYWNEKGLFGTSKGFHSDVLGELSQESKNRLPKVKEWWNEVSEYLPSSALLRLLVTVYFNALCRDAGSSKRVLPKRSIL